MGHLKQFKLSSDHLSVIDNCLFADFVVVPSNLGKVILKQLHSYINQMKTTAQNVMYEPNVNMEKIVKSYISCVEVQNNPPRIVDSHWTYSEQL